MFIKNTINYVFFIIILFVAGCSKFSFFQDSPSENISTNIPDSIEISLIYNKTANFQENYSIEIDDETDIIYLKGINLNINTTSLSAEIIVNGTQVEIEYLEIINSDLNINDILNNYIGSEIIVRPDIGKDTIGTLISAQDYIFIIDEEDNLRIFPWDKISYIKTSNTAINLNNVPQLAINLKNLIYGTAKIKLSYLAEGIAWKLNYNCNISLDDKQITLHPVIEISNNTNIKSNNATVKCIYQNETNGEQSLISTNEIRLIQNSNILLNMNVATTLLRIDDETIKEISPVKELIETYSSLYSKLIGIFKTNDAGQFLFPETVKTTINKEENGSSQIIEGTIIPIDNSTVFLYEN